MLKSTQFNASTRAFTSFEFQIIVGQMVLLQKLCLVLTLKRTLITAPLLPCVSLLKITKNWECHSAKEGSQLMTDITTFLADQSRDWCCIPGDFHAQCSTQETERKGCNCAPPKRKQLVIVPCIPVVILPARVAENDVFFDYHDQVNDGPISNDREEGLQCVFEESCSAATDRDGCNVAKGNKRNAWDTKCPGPKILRVNRE